MDGNFDFIMPDEAGNSELLAFIYCSDKLRLDKLWGEVALTKREYPTRAVKVHYRESGQAKTRKHSLIFVSCPSTGIPILVVLGAVSLGLSSPMSISISERSRTQRTRMKKICPPRS